MSARHYHIDCGPYGFPFVFVQEESGPLLRFASLLRSCVVDTLKAAEFYGHEGADRRAFDITPELVNIIGGARVMLQIAEAMHDEAAELNRAEQGRTS